MRLAIRTTIQTCSSSSSTSKPKSNPTSSPCKSPMLSWTQLKPQTAKYNNAPKLGTKWKQYQGINNWEGMLDPLDDNLRWEILRYGHFVDATYHSCDFDSSMTYGTCRYSKNSLLRKCGLAHFGYRLTKNLNVTCGINLPSWIDKIYKHARNRSSWIGYVAVCENKKEITRLGRRDVVIALRGTITSLEWLENLRATQTSLPGHIEDKENCPMVQKGFLSLYTSRTTHPSLQEMIREEIRRIIKSYHNEPLSLTLTGHSLGAALATLSAYDITATFKNAPMITVISFGGPRVGNKSFRKEVEHSGIRILRIVNSDDVITRIPGLLVNIDDDVAFNGDVHVARLWRWLHRQVEDMQLVYADVGEELRLSSKESMYIKNGDVGACHDLKTYLHLVKCFVSSSCSY
ncbi:hypothetical protein RIF29_18310 [Crotalaria pallida]|uniref:Fungal lipase-type domain-containing protein n=1 Tax=Crotalaria pallida TaxID=3830 RepID=A0AAN9FK79_CROPI